MIGFRLFTTATIAVGILAMPAWALDENSKKYDDLGQISDVALKAIEAAKPEFLKWAPKTGPYTVGVVETDHLFQVSFCGDSQKQTIVFTQGDKEVGKWPRCPNSVTVELDKANFKVLDMNHNRD